jgi:hypothetical protein
MQNILKEPAYNQVREYLGYMTPIKYYDLLKLIPNLLQI